MKINVPLPVDAICKKLEEYRLSKTVSHFTYARDCECFRDGVEAAIDIIKTMVKPNSKPLTLEEIYEVYNEPLYFHCTVGHWSLNGWHIVKPVNLHYNRIAFNDLQLDNNEDNVVSLYNYSITWVAYRQKPEVANEVGN